jgi:uncharacterized protein YecE (DUF72 family)
VGEGEQTASIYLGCSGWHYDHWRDIFYDSHRHYLEQYTVFFRSVEVNSTFYQFPKEAQLKNWYAATPDDFLFSIKVNRHITHTKRLHDTRRALGDFFEICAALGHKLGPFLVGLSSSFKKDLERLDEFLSLLPDHRFAFEFRHDSWYSNDVLDRLKEQRNLSLVMLGAQFYNNIECFTDFAYIRWHARGGNLDVYSSDEIDYWACRIREVAQKADVFGYWNNDAHGYAPKNCLDLTRRLNLDDRRHRELS